MSHPPSDAVGDTFIPLIRLEQCPLDEGVFLEVAGRELAVFRLSEPSGVYVIDNSCPHASGNLSAGAVKDGVVKCPWHGWKFRLRDGRSAQGSVARVRTYPVQVRDGVVYVRLSTAEDPPAGVPGFT